MQLGHGEVGARGVEKVQDALLLHEDAVGDVAGGFARGVRLRGALSLLWDDVMGADAMKSEKGARRAGQIPGRGRRNGPREPYFTFGRIEGLARTLRSAASASAIALRRSAFAPALDFSLVLAASIWICAADCWTFWNLASAASSADALRLPLIKRPERESSEHRARLLPTESAPHLPTAARAREAVSQWRTASRGAM